MGTTRRSLLRGVLGAVPGVALAQTAGTTAAARQWDVHEIPLTAQRAYDNPYTQVEVTAVFTAPDGTSQRVRGFWEAGSSFKVRFTPTQRGRWQYAISSSPADAGLTASGSLQAGAPRPGAHGFLRQDVRNPYHFAFDDGTPYFMFGTTYYDLLSNAAEGNRWQESVEGIRRYGMNKVRLSIARLVSERSPRSPYMPSQPFVNRDQDRLDVKHFQALDRVVRHLGERDVIADLIVFAREQVATGSDEQYRRFLRYIVARYGAFPNVIWCMTNEWEYTKQPRPFWDAMGRLTAQEDPWARQGQARRGLSCHQQTRYDFQMFEASQDWLSHAIVQLGVRNRGKAMRGGDEWNLAGRDLSQVMRHGDDWGHFSISYNWGHNMPVVNDEYGYIGEPQDETEPKAAAGKTATYTRAKHRRTMWGIYLAGGYASAGDKNQYDDGRPYFSGNWHDTTEYGDVRRLVDFWTKRGIAYWQRQPEKDGVMSQGRAYACRAGKDWVVYAADGGEVTVRLPEGAYTVVLFDPRTGEEKGLAGVKGGAVRLGMPDRQDWVVHLRRG